MLEIWKQKAPKQAQWFVKYPQQVTKQAKQVWKWAIAAGEGQAWLYFIFAVCQWLPTNYRVHYADESGYERRNVISASQTRRKTWRTYLCVLLLNRSY